MARRSILNRSFSTREKVLILVLVALLLVACYYFLVVKNVADTKAENDLQLQEIQMQVDTQTALAMARTRMENELAELGDVGKLPVVVHQQEGIHLFRGRIHLRYPLLHRTQNVGIRHR